MRKKQWNRIQWLLSLKWVLQPLSALRQWVVGAPISQTIYGMLLMNFILSKAAESGFTNWGGCLGAGIFGGLGMMASAWYQGKSAAVACDALGETGKGMVNYLMVLGIVETVALFVLVFSMMVL